MPEPWRVINSHGNGAYAIKTLSGRVINGPLQRCGGELCGRGYPAATANRISIKDSNIAAGDPEVKRKPMRQEGPDMTGTGAN